MTVTIGFISMSEQAYLVALISVTVIVSLVIIYLTIKKYKSPFPELTRYVSQAAKSGKKKSEIKELLLMHGWPEKAVNYELSKNFK